MVAVAAVVVGCIPQCFAAGRWWCGRKSGGPRCVRVLEAASRTRMTEEGEGFLYVYTPFT